MKQTDGYDYWMLADSMDSIRDVNGLVVEVGLGPGDGSKTILSRLSLNNDLDRTLVVLDPYGGLPYREKETSIQPCQYDNALAHKVLQGLHEYAAEIGAHFIYLPLEDSEFIARFQDGVPIYTGGHKELVNTYALVHFDGPHCLEAVKRETAFFSLRSVVGSMFVYDDVRNYHHIQIHIMLGRDWTVIEQTDKKMAYRREK